MKQILLSTTLTLAVASPFALQGADLPENPNRLSLGPRFGMNFKADFGGSPTVNPGPAAAGADHTYNDGYVLKDISGNAGGLTWNWGYQNGSQNPPAGVGNTASMLYHAIQFDSPNTAAGNSGSITDDPQYGGELTYQRVMWHFLGSGRLGFELGVGFTDINLRDDRNATGAATLTTDTFPLNGVLPPLSPYNGTFAGPGALLGDSPSRITAAGNATLSSRQELSGQLWTIRLGPFAEWKFTPKFSIDGSVGLTLAPAWIDYDFSDPPTVAGGGTYAANGHSSKSDFLYGPYASATLRYDFTERWGVYVGAQIQSLTDLKQSVGTRAARLDQDFTVYGVAGISFKF